MKISVCGIGCEICPKMQKGECPNGEVGCVPRENKFCKICSCAFAKNIRHCFDCVDFPCETTKEGPVSYGYCQYIAGKA